MEAYIKEITYILPEKVVTNEYLVKDFKDWTATKIAEKVGVEERHIAQSETATDLAIKAAEKLFSLETVKKEDIDFILFCTQSPDYILPSSACIIQNLIGLPTSAGAMDFNLGCSGYEYGLALAKGLIVAGISKNILLLTGETYSKYIHPLDIGNRTIFGDGASATIVSTDGFAQIMNFSLGTNGKGAENLIIKTGGARFPKKKNDLIKDTDGNPCSSDYLYMDGTELFLFTLKTVPKLINDVLKNNVLKKEDISLFIFHQANQYMLKHLRDKLNIDENKFYIDMKYIGNTVSSTIPIALCNARRQDKIKGNVLLAGFGVGYSWGGCVLKCMC